MNSPEGTAENVPGRQSWDCQSADQSTQERTIHFGPHDAEFTAPLPQPGFAMPGFRPSLSNKLNATAPINSLIWTALKLICS
jgi:hypothetical protein